jgi:septum formation protein
MADIYLASRSPRRRELLKQIGVRFEPLIIRLAAPRGPDVDEVQHAGEAPGVYVERVAREKAEFALKVLSLRSMVIRPVLSADTVVILDGAVLGKPANATEAAAFLRQLSGTTHEVRTSIAVAQAIGHKTRLVQRTSVSSVKFKPLEDDEIASYVATGEPLDKAGGYGIQGYAGLFVEHLQGSYTGVMGLPLYETALLLRQVGVKV